MLIANIIIIYLILGILIVMAAAKILRTFNEQLEQECDGDKELEQAIEMINHVMKTDAKRFLVIIILQAPILLVKSICKLIANKRA